MQRDKYRNIARIAVAALILVVVNVGILMAAREGVIAPLDNAGLWCCFVVLNIVSIMWVIAQLGLQPLVVALSYVGGGFLAYQGVKGTGGLSVAEITTAGATYGAFGAMTAGNIGTKVRLAFYNKKQVPFVFIIAALLVLDAVLNSGISKAGGNVMLNALVFPFALAGVTVGLGWSILNRFGIGREAQRAVTVADAAVEEEETPVAEENASALMIHVPEDADLEADEEHDEVVAEDEVEPAMSEEPEEEKKMAPAAASNEEAFFPLEIDKDDSYVDSEEFSSESADDDVFSMSSFDSNLYNSGAIDDAQGGVLVEEPAISVAIELEEETAADEEKAVSEAPSKQEAGTGSKKSEDWLSGHLDLLNKLK